MKNGNNHNLPVTVNTDDLGIFYTSLPREFELLTLALLKKKTRMVLPCIVVKKYMTGLKGS